MDFDAEQRVVAVVLGRAESAAAVLRQRLPDWQWHAFADPEALAQVRDLRPALGIIVPPAIPDRSAVAWCERIAMPGCQWPWIALLSARQRAEPDLLRSLAAICQGWLPQPLEVDGDWPAVMRYAVDSVRLRALLPAATPGVADRQMVGNSPAMQRLQKLIRKFAAVDAPVMIYGESGTGKELVARAIHRNSSRARGAFVAVNCGAIPEHLVESELFGHVRGAFTGALQDRKGRVALADGGTLFLDEIGDLPLVHQVKILRFLQEGSFERVGSPHSTQVDVRVIAATHVDLAAAVNTQRFREDLFYRLNVLHVRVPPLRERGGDLEALAAHFLTRAQRSVQGVARDFSSDARAAIRRHHWPGNVRELINRVSKAAVVAEAPLITPADLDLPGPSGTLGAGASQTLREARDRAEQAALEKALQASGFNLSEAAAALGVSRMTVYRLLQKHGIRLSQDSST